jgi:ADP-heptose:LPS heptosyltransferase
MIHNGDIFDRKYYAKMVKYVWNKYIKISKGKKISIAKNYFNLIIKKKFFRSIGLSFELKSKNTIKFDRTKKIITFFCSTDHEYTSFSFQKKKNNFYINSKWTNQIEAIKSLVNVIKKDQNIFLFIKAHPNFSKKKSIENQIKKLESPKVKYLSNNSEVDSMYLLKNSDVVVTFGSSIELTARYLNKKVIPMFKHLYSDLGMFNYPKNDKSLKNMIYEYENIKKNSVVTLLKIAYFLMTFGTNYKFYKSSSFFRGNLVEEKINHFGPIINFLIKIKILKY